MRRLLNFRYPKLSILIVLILLAYFLFSEEYAQSVINSIGLGGVLGLLIAGFFFSFGFTAPFSVGYFVTSGFDHIILSALIASVAAMISNLLIITSLRFSFKDEFRSLENEKIVRKIENFVKNEFGNKISLYLVYAFAGFLIASPLPNEAGDFILAGLSKISFKILTLISFILSFLGIAILLWI